MAAEKNSPALEGEDDFYELFLAALENIRFCEECKH